MKRELNLTFILFYFYTCTHLIMYIKQILNLQFFESIIVNWKNVDIIIPDKKLSK